MEGGFISVVMVVIYENVVVEGAFNSLVMVV